MSNNNSSSSNSNVNHHHQQQLMQWKHAKEAASAALQAAAAASNSGPPSCAASNFDSSINNASSSSAQMWPSALGIPVNGGGWNNANEVVRPPNNTLGLYNVQLQQGQQQHPHQTNQALHQHHSVNQRQQQSVPFSSSDNSSNPHYRQQLHQHRQYQNQQQNTTRHGANTGYSLQQPHYQLQQQQHSQQQKQQPQPQSQSGCYPQSCIVEGVAAGISNLNWSSTSFDDDTFSVRSRVSTAGGGGGWGTTSVGVSASQSTTSSAWPSPGSTLDVIASWRWRRMGNH
jgi:hypothetical protein